MTNDPRKIWPCTHKQPEENLIIRLFIFLFRAEWYQSHFIPYIRDVPDINQKQDSIMNKILLKKKSMRKTCRLLLVCNRSLYNLLLTFDEFVLCKPSLSIYTTKYITKLILNIKSLYPTFQTFHRKMQSTFDVK